MNDFNPFDEQKPTSAPETTPEEKTVEINGQKVKLTPELEMVLKAQQSATINAEAVTEEKPVKQEAEEVQPEKAKPNNKKKAKPTVKEALETTFGEKVETPADTAEESIPDIELPAEPETPSVKEEVKAEPAEEPAKAEETPNDDEVVEQPSIPEVPEKPKEKELKFSNMTPEQREVAMTNNISNFASVILGSNDDLNEALRVEYDADTRDRKEKVSDPSDYLMAGSRALQFGVQTENQRFIQRLLNTITEQNANIGELIKELKLARISAASYLKKSHDSTLSGDLGGLAVIAATQGTYRIMLYNSGFHIIVRPITIEMANDFIQEVDREFENLGRILGSFYHLPLSVYLKQKMADLLPQIVVGSNLKDWRNKTNLLKAISFNDYETILWALGTMLFRDGIGIGLICTNKDCRHHEINEFVDLAKTCYLNLDKVNGEAVAWLMDSAQRSMEDIEHYKKDIIKNYREFKPEGSQIKYVFRDPSLKSYINHGLDLIAKLTDAINNRTDVIYDDDNDDTVREKEKAIAKEKQRQLSLHMYKMLIPWIDHLEVEDNQTKEIVNVTGMEAVAASLEVRTKYSENLYNQIEDFIRDSRCAYFCVNHLKCPSCGKVLDYKNHEMTTLDVEYVFFCLSCLMLEQAGLGDN